MKENTAAIHAQVPVDVATFLLNEKRSEFHAIEQRLKVSVVLIPNIHLETPNYNVTRLRHDELNQMEPLPASYRLTDQPTEVEKPAVPGAEVKLQPRPQAAVQGITPGQPAPVPAAPVPPAKPSILQKVFGWLTRKPADQPEPVKTKPREQRRPVREAGRHERRGRDEQSARRHAQSDGARPAQQPARRERGERGERGQQRAQPQAGQQPAKPEAVTQADSRTGSGERTGRRDRPERGDRHERAERQERGDRPDRPDRPERPERTERPERQERPRGEGGPNEAGEGRGRRRRGRRERGGRGEGDPARTEIQDSPAGLATAASLAVAAEPGAEAARDRVVTTISEPVPAELAATAIPVYQEQPSEEPLRAQPVPLEPLSQPVAEAVPPPAVPEPPAPRYEREDELRESSHAERHPEPEDERRESSHAERYPEPAAYRAPALAETYVMPPDLVQVETTHAAALGEPVVPAGDQPRRPRRPRAQEAAAEGEPLVQIETRPVTSPTE